MDADCRSTFREAEADPDDDGRRLAHGLALLRAGFRVAAAYELSVASAYGADTESLAAVVFEDRQGEAWQLLDPEGLFTGVAPLTPDARVRGALVERDGRTLPLALLAVERCPRCTNGETGCERCDGRGFDRHELAHRGRTCGQCSGNGTVLCEVCSGDAILVGEIEPGEGCGHGAIELEDVDELPFKRWSLARCTTCGLAGVELEGGSRRFACRECGFFGCACASV